ncbi:hypothetical protein DH2020_020436 [Rehmannia glutinosa]|uniref:Uncharacterized protein n=1 Tax=Rehmannia glutinosa TaxID=99300 RepID=A0ABR0WG71_REHGL
MAPGRKRGAKGAKTKSELSLGDLVLAKVKGFPAWPAKISRPEDWERAPDPKKYFVQFFGAESDLLKTNCLFLASNEKLCFLRLPVDVVCLRQDDDSVLPGTQSIFFPHFWHKKKQFCHSELLVVYYICLPCIPLFESLDCLLCGRLALPMEVASVFPSSSSCASALHVALLFIVGYWYHIWNEKKDFGIIHGLISPSLNRAFVAPADIQAFTSEAKNKLSARCQGKTVRYFAQAVKEICEEFEVLQRKKMSGIRDDNNAENLASEAQSVDPVVDEAVKVSANVGLDMEGPNCKLEIKGMSDLGSGCERSQRKGEIECQYVKPSSSDDINHSSSPYLSSGKRSKLSTNPTIPVKESALGSIPPSHASVKEEGSLDVKVEDWCSDGGQSELENGQQSKLAMGPKRKREGTMRRNSGSVISHERIGDGLQVKRASGGNMQVSCADNSRPSLDLGSERKGKKLLKEKKHSGAVNDDRLDDEVIFEEHNEVISRKKMKFQHGHEKQTSRTNEASCPAKISKGADIVDDARMLRAQKSRKDDSRSPVDLDDKMDNTESKRLISCGKAENHRSFRVQTSNNDSNHSAAEGDLPPIKRHCRAGGMVSTSAVNSEKRSGSSASRKNGLVNPNKVRSPVMQPTKRRAVRLCDDDDDELPKTPVHGGFSHKVSVIPRAAESKKKIIMRGEGCANDQMVLRNSGTVDDASKEQVQSSRFSNKASSPTSQQGVEKRTIESSAEHVSPNPRESDSEKLPLMEAKPVVVSPRSVTSIRPSAEPQKKHFSKTPGSISQKKISSGGNRDLATASDGSSLNQSITERSKPTSPGEKKKTTPISDSKINDSVLLVGNPDESITSLGERLDVGKDSKTSFPVDLKISDSVMSMKHLIAAAQARKRQAHLQSAYVNHFPLLVPDADMLVRSPSLTPGTLAVESNNTLQKDVQGLHPNSPPSDVRHLSSVNEHENEEFEERRASSGHQATGSSLSGGTEAAVARDAFEGMIETLSRTKESIGRATRLAIDCAKYGIANEVLDKVITSQAQSWEQMVLATFSEMIVVDRKDLNVVELLIHKLKNEPSFHRKVDLFFLVDSITQCSHSQKGIAGASYLPIVQAALPRLIELLLHLGQLLMKIAVNVLRLWLERKILPESVLRRYMDDIGATNDETSTGFSLRRLSRAERSIDDPIRDMEGMLVDEYGSNATFQLPGFPSSRFFEEEDEDEDEDNFPTKYKEVADTSPSEHNTPASRDLENCAVTPSDRRHCILEDVDGELEMEDVSAHQKDERPLCVNGTSEVASLEPNSDGFFQSASNMSELLLSPEGSPPLPPGSPPATPPLPPSPPPSSPSPPPPPPPPPPSSPSPPPPPPSLQQHLFPPPPVGPPPFLSQQSLPPQPALMPQHMPPLPSTLSSSQPLTYHPPPLPYEIGGTPTGNPHPHMVSNTHGPRIDAPVRGEVFTQQSSFFSPAAVSNAREPVGYNSYGQSDGYLKTQAPQQRQPFLPGSAPFAQRPLHPEPPIQQIPSHFSYPNSAQQHQYPPYSLPNFSDGQRRNATDEQWRMQVNEFNSDCPRGGWMAGGRSCSGPSYSHEDYYGPPPERPPTSVVNYHPSAANSLPAAPISGDLAVHGVQMMPSRPDMSAVNWRPA